MWDKGMITIVLESIMMRCGLSQSVKWLILMRDEACHHTKSGTAAREKWVITTRAKEIITLTTEFII